MRLYLETQEALAYSCATDKKTPISADILAGTTGSALHKSKLELSRS